MSPSTTPKGYHVVGLTKDGKREYFRLCRLMALTFLPNPDNLPIVNHKNEIPCDDYIHINEDGTVNAELSNLEWCDYSYNAEYSIERKRERINTKNMREQLKISFYCRQQNVKDGKAPVEVCINTKGARTVFRLQESYPPDEFRKKREGVRDNDVKRLCLKVQEKFAEINKRFPGLDGPEYKRLYFEGMPVEFGDNLTVSMLCKSYLDNVMKGRTTERHSRNTCERFCEKYGTTPANSITAGDIKRFITDSGLAEGTKRNYFKHLKSVFTYGFEKRYIQSNPFAGLRMQFKDPDPVYLTPEEVNRIAWLGLGPRLARARDLFLFMAGSGLEYSDCQELGPDDVKEKDGIWYIQKKRVKTDVEYTAVLINHALDVWKTYEGLLPQISNQVLNRFLKEIATMANITKNVTTLTARHVYATSLLSGTYTLPGREDTKPITIDVLRRCLGHTHMTQSLRYATLLDESLFDAFGTDTKAGPAGSQRVREK